MSYYMSCFIDSLHQTEYFNINILNDIWNTYFSVWVNHVVTTPTTFIYFNTVRIEHRLITVDIHYFCPCFTLLIIY